LPGVAEDDSIDTLECRASEMNVAKYLEEAAAEERKQKRRETMRRKSSRGVTETANAVELQRREEDHLWEQFMSAAKQA
jgi:hypothetical protein